MRRLLPLHRRMLHLPRRRCSSATRGGVVVVALGKARRCIPAYECMGSWLYCLNLLKAWQQTSKQGAWGL